MKYNIFIADLLATGRFCLSNYVELGFTFPSTHIVHMVQTTQPEVVLLFVVHKLLSKRVLFPPSLLATVSRYSSLSSLYKNRFSRSVHSKSMIAQMFNTVLTMDRYPFDTK